MAASGASARVAHERIYAVVARIPRGRVATYGQVAGLAGMPRNARQVGFALRKLPDSRAIPWHRVVNGGGTMSPREDPDSLQIQSALLRHEGVRIDGGGHVDLRLYQWRPRT